ncbi:MAG: hypothetical protein KAQ69_11515 [Spirochaetales bacterium]|nr:hypothetical protein [Spirochaetales bacterium]
MKTATKIGKRINRMQEGIIFKYKHLNIAPEEYSAAAKAIERLIAKKVIKRVSTGLFYKPKGTVFGELRPREKEIVRAYLFEQNKRIAYVTGTALYNRMGLTSQVPKIIKLASLGKRITVNTGGVQAKPVKSYVNVTNDNYYLLEILDVLKDFTIIPDLNKKMAIKNLLNTLKELAEKDKVRIIKFALNYPPRTRALLGALFNKICSKQFVTILKQSLNPLSTYKLGINEEMLSTTPNWNIS